MVPSWPVAETFVLLMSSMGEETEFLTLLAYLFFKKRAVAATPPIRGGGGGGGNRVGMAKPLSPPFMV